MQENTIKTTDDKREAENAKKENAVIIYNYETRKYIIIR